MWGLAAVLLCIVLVNWLSVSCGLRLNRLNKTCEAVTLASGTLMDFFSCILRTKWLTENIICRLINDKNNPKLQPNKFNDPLEIKKSSHFELCLYTFTWSKRWGFNFNCSVLNAWKNACKHTIFSVCFVLCNLICSKRWEMAFALMIISACLHILRSQSKTLWLAVGVTLSEPFGTFHQAIFCIIYTHTHSVLLHKPKINNRCVPLVLFLIKLCLFVLYVFF